MVHCSYLALASDSEAMFQYGPSKKMSTYITTAKQSPLLMLNILWRQSHHSCPSKSNTQVEAVKGG
jgi:hypothetical protein